MLEIDEQDMKELRTLMRRAERPYLRIKAAALWNLGRGRTAREVADFLGVSTTSISNWTRRFRSEGISGLAVRPGRGRKARADVSEVERYVRQSPQSFGLVQTRWTLHALAQVVPSLEGFTEMGVWKVLKRAGFRYKRGQPYLHSPDPQYEEKKGALDQALREAAENPGEVIALFTDEVSFYRQPSQARLWASMGRRQPRLRYSDRGNTLMRVVGLLEAAKAGVHVWEFPKVTAGRLAGCFRQIGSLYPEARRIYLIMDNWQVHFHPKVQAALASEPRIQVVPLPTYAPWLNNIEKLWRWTKQRITHAHPWSDDFLLFRRQVLDEFHRLDKGSPELKRYCGLQVFS